MSLVTVQSLIDSARVRHWSFSALEAGDGAALLFLTSRLRTHLAQHGAKIEGLVGTTMQYTLPVSTPALLVTTTGAILATNYGQSIVANAGTGTPFVTTAYQDGWPVHLDGNGVPYVDFSEAPIATDPFALNGGTPGFPLPTDMIRLIAVALVYASGSVIPCDVISEPQRFTMLPGRNPSAFVSANRLVPVQLTTSTATDTRWSTVASVQISYVGVQSLSTLTDVLNIPAVLAEALIADLAQYFAMQSKVMPVPEKAGFAAESARCSSMVAGAALDLLNEPMMSTVHYLG